ncbi:hypothetical protein [Metabacillus sp. RGM 3146]|uniref:hypothetical protein n=1 Tax=Metabacillus sp. RGM 3146 TaxID=3401092 RepID=UPI003B990D88
MWWGHHGFFPFGLFFLIPLFVFLAIRIILFRRYGSWCFGPGHYQGRYDAETILMQRLARGEISEEEYLRLREIMQK